MSWPRSQRIARDLHDLVIQRLYATGMSLEGTLPMVTRPEVTNRISNAVDEMDETIKDIRATIFQLQARGDADQRDLRGDILALVEEMTSMLGFVPSLRLGAGLGAEVSDEVAEQSLAALREALSNAARHSGASQVDVVVDVDPDGTLSGASPAADGRPLAAFCRTRRYSCLAWCSCSSPKTRTAYAAAWVRRSMPSLANSADT